MSRSPVAVQLSVLSSKSWHAVAAEALVEQELMRFERGAKRSHVERSRRRAARSRPPAPRKVDFDEGFAARVTYSAAGRILVGDDPQGKAPALDPDLDEPRYPIHRVQGGEGSDGQRGEHGGAPPGPSRPIPYYETAEYQQLADEIIEFLVNSEPSSRRSRTHAEEQQHQQHQQVYPPRTPEWPSTFAPPTLRQVRWADEGALVDAQQPVQPVRPVRPVRPVHPPAPASPQTPHTPRTLARPERKSSDGDEGGSGGDEGAILLSPLPQLPRGWTHVPEASRAQAVESAVRFEAAHHRHHLQARHTLRRLGVGEDEGRAEGRPSSMRRQRACSSRVAAMRTNRCTLQPLRFGALVSPRHGVQLQRLSLVGESRSDGQVGGPWRAEDRVLAGDGGVREGEEEARRRVFALEQSIWAPRRKWADSRSFFETRAFLRMAIEADWAMARVGGGLDKFVQRHQTRRSLAGSVSGGQPQPQPQPQQQQQPGGGSGAGTGDDGVMSSVRDALASHSEAIFAAFDFYAMAGASSDFTAIQLNAYKAFLDDCGLVEAGAEGCLNAALWDELFIVINAAGGKAVSADQFNHKKGLNRQEFVSLLCRAAILRYLVPEYRVVSNGDDHAASGAASGTTERDRSSSPLPPTTTDPETPAAAVRALLTTIVIPKLHAAHGPFALLPANTFRQQFCYLEAPSDVLLKFSSQLRVIFDVYCFGDGVDLNPLDTKDRLGYDEWRRLLSDLSFVDSQCNERVAQSAFVLSRMRVMRENEVRGRARLLQLCFEDFFEALIRLCLQKALPTDQEIALAESADAGVYLLEMQMEEGGAAWPDFLATHEPPADGEPSGGQPVDRALEHLLALMVRSIQLVVVGRRALESNSLELSAEQVRAFHKLGGRTSSRAGVGGS